MINMLPYRSLPTTIGIPLHSGAPAMPDAFSDERIFRARTIAAIKELYRRLSSTSMKVVIGCVKNGGEAVVITSMPLHRGAPAMPDAFSDERIFRARTIAAIKELYRRSDNTDTRVAAWCVVRGDKTTAIISASPHRGVPAMPDTSSDERIFRARTIEAIKELYRRPRATIRCVGCVVDGAVDDTPPIIKGFFAARPNAHGEPGGQTYLRWMVEPDQPFDGVYINGVSVPWSGDLTVSQSCTTEYILTIRYKGRNFLGFRRLIPVYSISMEGERSVRFQCVHRSDLSNRTGETFQESDRLSASVDFGGTRRQRFYIRPNIQEPDKLTSTVNYKGVVSQSHRGAVNPAPLQEGITADVGFGNYSVRRRGAVERTFQDDVLYVTTLFNTAIYRSRLPVETGFAEGLTPDVRLDTASTGYRPPVFNGYSETDTLTASVAFGGTMSTRI